MKCPRCKTENDTRTICKKCGYYMYHPDVMNRAKMTKSQQALEDSKIVGKKIGKVLKIIYIIITIIVLSAWLVAGMVFLTGFISG